MFLSVCVLFVFVCSFCVVCSSSFFPRPCHCSPSSPHSHPNPSQPHPTVLSWVLLSRPCPQSRPPNYSSRVVFFCVVLAFCCSLCLILFFHLLKTILFFPLLVLKGNHFCVLFLGASSCKWRFLGLCCSMFLLRRDANRILGQDFDGALRSTDSGGVVWGGWWGKL